MAHGHHRQRRQHHNRSALLLGYTVEPEDVKYVVDLHSGFANDKTYVDFLLGRRPAAVEDNQDDEGGFVERSLERWRDRR